jgi:hypothetical protein
MKSRRHLVRIPALALLVLLSAAWAPCFACQGPLHEAGPGLATRAVCHGSGDTAAPSCAQNIRAAGPALRVSVPPAAAVASMPAPAAELTVLAPGAPPAELPHTIPLSRPSLYLLHGILLA